MAQRYPNKIMYRLTYLYLPINSSSEKQSIFMNKNARQKNKHPELMEWEIRIHRIDWSKNATMVMVYVVNIHKIRKTCYCTKCATTTISKLYLLSKKNIL